MMLSPFHNLKGRWGRRRFSQNSVPLPTAFIPLGADLVGSLHSMTTSHFRLIFLVRRSGRWAAHVPEMLYNWAVDMSGPFDLVIFDCDGVLADTETLDNQVVSVLLEEAGHTIALEEVAARASGLTDDAMLTLVEKELGHPLPEGIRDRRESMLLETFRESLTPTPGLQEAVRQLSAKNVTLCVASNGRLEKVAQFWTSSV